MKKVSLHTQVLFFLMACCLLPVGTGYAQINAQLTASRQEVLDFLGASSAKVIFENNGFLYYIDYSAVSPQITQLSNTAGGILPSISPDGNWIVFANGVISDGRGGSGSVWISELSPDAIPILAADPGFEPRFIQNSGGNLDVIYTTEGGANLYDAKGKTVKKSIINLVPDVAATDVFTGGGYVGGLSWDNRYLATGYQEGRMVDLQDPNLESKKIHQLEFTNTTTGADTIIGLQVCNISISSSRTFTGAMMYIDFGFRQSNYMHGRIAGGALWGIHNIIFISNYNNEVIRFFEIPSLETGSNSGDISEYHWDDPEWSNHPYYAAANLEVDRIFEQADGWEHVKKHEQVYLINIKDSTYMKVMESTEGGSFTAQTDLQWPWLWIDVPAGFEEEGGWLTAATKKPIMKKEDQIGFYICNHTVFSDSPMSKLSVLDITGTLIKVISFNEKNVFSVKLTDNIIARRGIYILKAQTVKGPSRALLWPVM
jgi:hypothetical protein